MEDWLTLCYNRIPEFKQQDCCGNCKFSELLIPASYLRLCKKFKDEYGNPIQVPYNGFCKKHKSEKK